MGEPPRYEAMRGRHKQTAAIVAIAVLLAATTGCGEDSGYHPTTVSPVPSGAGDSSSPSGTDGMSDEDQIRTLYNEFAVENWTAEKLPASQRRSYLERWMIDPALSRYLDGMAQLRKRGRIDKGKPVPHVKRIKINGKTAILVDCSDQSGIETVTSSGKVVDRGERYTALTVTMRRTASGWRVSDTDIGDKRCAES